MPLLENNANKQFFNVNLLKNNVNNPPKSKKPHDLPKNPTSMVDIQEKRHFFSSSNEVILKEIN